MALTRIRTTHSLIVGVASVAVVVWSGSAAGAASSTSQSARQAAGAPARASVATVSPIAALPAGPVPMGVPYGIGKRLYLNGKAYDFTTRWTALASRYAYPQFAAVTITRGVVVWAVDETQTTDPLASVGVMRPGEAPVFLRQVLDFPGLATTTGGLITSGLEAYLAATTAIFTVAGADYGPPFSYSDNGGLPGPIITVQGAGGSFVFQGRSATAGLTVPSQSYAMYPGYAAVQLPYDDTYGVGNGWLATADSHTSDCYRTAALTSPATLRADICSQSGLVVNTAGTMAVVVQANHVLLYDTITGAQINATNAPTLTTQGYSPMGWETPTTYLVNAKDGNSLYILRCSATTGACQRAVTSYVRPGVSYIA
jgi:hypothetical protein